MERMVHGLLIWFFLYFSGLVVDPFDEQNLSHRVHRGHRENVERMWRECGENVERMWRECGENVERMWRECGENVERMWRECGEIFLVTD